MAELAAEVLDRPRHLGIHSAGMVLCDRPVVEVCPVEWGRMPGRSVLQWDKDDCAAIGLVKFDLLGLGMLEALHRMVDLVRDFHGVEVDLAQLPQEPAVYDLLVPGRHGRGLPGREPGPDGDPAPGGSPACFYDLAIEVALIRPGPIQGHAVNPYIRRRRGEEQVTYLHPLLEPILERTLGVPLFQEQLMEMAVAIAGFSAAEADELRQAMAAKRSAARMEKMRARLFDGHGRPRRDGRGGRPGLRGAGRLRQLRLPRVALGVVRVPGVLVGLAEAALPGGVHRGAARTRSPWGSGRPSRWWPTPAGTGCACAGPT